MSTVQSHVALILDDLAKKAVAEIITLFDNTFAAFIEELCKKQNEIDHLKKKLVSPQDVNTAGNIVHEKPSVLSYGEFSVNLQTSNEQTDLEPKSSSTVVTQWDFPDEQQYDFEGVNDDSETSPLTEEEVDDTATVYSRDPVDCTRSEYGDGEFGELEFELKAAEVDRLTEEAESGTMVLRHSPTSNIHHHNANSSIPRKKKVGRPRKSPKIGVGRPRKLPKIAVAETTETTIAETQEVERIPAKDIRRRRKVKVTSTMTCPECKQVFYRPKDFIKHRFSHKQKQLLTCEWCGITFPFQSQMQNHIRIHTGERPFSCNVCDKSFISKGQLKSHMWYHKSKEKGESCSLCGADSLESLEGYTLRRRSTRPCAKCGKAKSVI
ncbi:uncharacterized protein LOC143135115 [Alosa pseudoharengus]|uniref:uncharacterized protein LOC143135115 n=1 Tax=Alosa pseudoharengus TaxID=34774 RepID=UPI003F8BD98F